MFHLFKDILTPLFTVFSPPPTILLPPFRYIPPYFILLLPPFTVFSAPFINFHLVHRYFLPPPCTIEPIFLPFPVFLLPFTLLIPLLIVFPPSIQHVHTPSIVLPPQFTVIFSPFIHIISASVHQIVSIYSQYFSSSVHNIIPAVLFYFLCLSYFGYFFSIYPI